MKTQQVSSLINCLTNNEDERQDLWVHYLSGNTEHSFASKLQEIQQVNIEDLKIKEALHTIYSLQSDEKLSQVFASFSDFERHIVFLLLIDYTPSRISSYKGISEVRIRQAIQAIRYNSGWENYYGSEETIDGRREVRPKPGRNKTGRKIPKKI